MNTTETNLIFEAYAKSKPLTESHSHMQEVEAERRAQEEERRNEMAAEIGPDPDDVDREYAEDGESVGDFDEFIGKAEKFVDEIGDDGLEFLANLHKDQFEVLMDVVSDQRGYRNQMPAEDYES